MEPRRRKNRLSVKADPSGLTRPDLQVHIDHAISFQDVV
jgi:hypothetical protein